MKIENYLVPLAYEISKKVFEGKMKLKEGKQIIVGENKMNPNSAADYINNFKYLLQGKRFTRTLNYFSMDYFLSNIYRDYGRMGLSNSINALKKHKDYYEGQQNVTMRKMRQLVNKYHDFNLTSNDVDFQNEIISKIKETNVSKNELIKQLISYKPKAESGQKLTKVQIKNRDNSIIAKLKIIRDFKCQICSKQIKKSDGSFYIEAAHIKPKREDGNESPQNILILCPNHHKEFDYGELKIKIHSKEKVEFVLNDELHKISLKLEPTK